MASPAEVREQRALLDRLAELAGGALARRWAQVDTTAELDTLRPELVSLLTGLVDAYGEAAAGLAADYYETARAASPAAPGRFTPRMPQVVTEDVRNSLAAAVVVSLRGILSGDPDMTRRDLDGTLDVHVKGAYRSTIAAAVVADPAANATWERVPAGGECDFCQDAAGTTEDGFHAHCRCVSMPVWLR